MIGQCAAICPDMSGRVAKRPDRGVSPDGADIPMVSMSDVLGDTYDIESELLEATSYKVIQRQISGGLGAAPVWPRPPPELESLHAAIDRVGAHRSNQPEVLQVTDERPTF